MKTEKLKKNRGITLIALVITIIVLLILAGVTIATLTGDNGILTKARKAKEETEQAQDNEIQNLEDMVMLIDNKKIEQMPDDEQHVELKTFITKWKVNDEDRSIILPIYEYKDNENGLQYEYNFNVDYGDGTPIVTITSATDSNRVHTYAKAGEYEVKITGKCEGFSFFNVPNSKDKIIEIVQWGVIGIKHIDFGGNDDDKGCTQITNIPNPSKNSFREAVDFSRLFYNCDGLNCEIPEYLFTNAPNLQTLQSAFASSTIKGSLAEDTFCGLPNIISFRDIFYDCDGLVGNIPENLFSNNLKVTNFQGVFAECSNLNGTIPEKLFANNIKATNFYATFSHCIGITGNIPEKLFCNNQKVETFFGTFESSGVSGSIPEKLFFYNTKVKNMEYTFYECKGLTGSIPENLFINNKEIDSFCCTFAWCINIDGILPINLFSSNNKVTNFTSTFDGCSKLQGNAIELWNRTNIEEFSYCYRGCSNLEGYPDAIPTSWR